MNTFIKSSQPFKFFVVFLGIVFLGLIGSEKAQAAAYTADNLLGQLDGTDSPVYTTFVPDNGRGNGARGFNLPEFTTIDTTNHRLFVSDSANSRVLVFHLNSNDTLIDRVADNIVAGCPGLRGQCGASTSQDGLNSPKDLAYDANNNRLFVADGNNNRVLVYNVATIINGEDAVNVLGQVNFTTGTANRGTGVNINTLHLPLGLAYDSANQRLFVSDSENHRIVVYDVTSITNGENAVAVLGQGDFTSGSANRGGSTAQNSLFSPYDVEYHASSNRLFVADEDNNRVLSFDVTAISDGENAANVLGQSNFTNNVNATTRGGMWGPQNVAYGSATANQLFVSDSGHNRILVYDAAAISPDGEDAANVLGQALFTTSTQATSQAGLYFPAGLAFSSTGNLLYAVETNNNRVGVYDVAGISDGEVKVNLLGQLDSSDNPVYTTNNADNGATININARGFNEPKSITLDTTNHRLFVTDTRNNRVLVFNLDTSNNLIDRVADNVLGQADFTSGVANRGGSIQSNTLWFPVGLAYDATLNRLFVSDSLNNRVLVYDVASITNGESADNVLGQANFTSGSSADTQTGMRMPADVAFFPSRNLLFVPNYSGNRVTVYDVRAAGSPATDLCANGTTTTGIATGMNASCVLGQANFTSSSSATTQAGMNNPIGLAIDTTNNRLFVVEEFNHRVTVFDVRANGSANTDLCANGTTTTGIATGMNASCVLGQANFTSSSSATTQAGMKEPNGVVFDSTHNRLYVMDELNVRVLVFDTAVITNGENAVNVLGQNSFTTDDDSTSQSTLSGPFRGSMDEANHRLYISDLHNARVIIYNLVLVTTSSLTAGTQNTAYSQTVSTSGSEGTLVFTISSGALPTGLSLAAGTGVISGTPTVAETGTFTVLATETGDVGTFVDSKALTLLINSSSGGHKATLAPTVSLTVSLGQHRTRAFLRIMNQLLTGTRLVPGRVTLAQTLMGLTRQAVLNTLDEVTSNNELQTQLRELSLDTHLRPLLRGHRGDFVLEIWEVGNRTTPISSMTVSTDLLGQATFSLPTLYVRAYDFTIRKTPFGLPRTLANVTLTDPLTLNFKDPIRVGDLNGDGKINTEDFKIFLQNLGTTQYDLNEDGKIDLQDVVDFLAGTR